jgi:quinol monooxygenase YgiN
MFTTRSCALWLMAVSLAAVTLSTATLAPVALADDKPPGDLFARLEANVKEDQPFRLLVKIQLKPGTEEKFNAAAVKAVKETVQEPGCEAYDLCKDLEQPGTVVLFEKWKSRAALKEHLAQPYTVALLKVLGEIEAAPDIRILSPVSLSKSAP